MILPVSSLGSITWKTGSVIRIDEKEVKCKVYGPEMYTVLESERNWPKIHGPDLKVCGFSVK